MIPSRSRHSDDGFSVVELMVAASILFFVLTAMVGLLGVSSQMTVTARERSVLTNAVASYIDEVRALPWDQIVTPGAPLQRVVNNVTVTINMTVETKQAQGDEYIKYARISATGVLNGQSQTYVTRVAMRNPSFNRTLSTDPDAPQVTFDDTVAPLEDEVLMLGERLNGGAISLKTKAFSPNDQITDVNYLVGSPTTALYPQLGGLPASYHPSPAAQTVYNSPAWNTNQQPGLVDGFQTVTVSVKDSRDRPISITRRFIIDNYAPGAPGTPIETALSATSINLAWTAARDGGIDVPGVPYYASRYSYTVSKEPSASVTTTTTAWSVVSSAQFVTAASYADAIVKGGPFSLTINMNDAVPPAFFYQRLVPPFSRLWARVVAGSPHFAAGGSASTTQLVVTRPEILTESGHQSTSATTLNTSGQKSSYTNEYSVVLWVTKPQFPSDTSAVTYTVQYLDTTNVAAGWQNLGATQDTGAVPAVSQADARATKITFIKRYPGGSGQSLDFRVGISGVKATGYLATGAAEPQLWTNAVGVTSTSTDASAKKLVANWAY